MTSYSWCTDCKILFTADDGHDEHDVNVLGDNCDNTIASLDDIIQYGLESVQKIESDVENARTVKKDIDTMKANFTTNLRSRIERIVQDLRVALDDGAMTLMGDVEKQVASTEANAQTVIRKSTVKLDTAKQFIQKAAGILPNEENCFTLAQFTELYNFYKSLEKVNATQEAEVKPISVNIKYPNSMKTKTECQNLAQRVIGEIENNNRPSLIRASRLSVDVINVRDFITE